MRAPFRRLHDVRCIIGRRQLIFTKNFIHLQRAPVPFAGAAPWGWLYLVFAGEGLNLLEIFSCRGPLLRSATLAEGHSCGGPLLRRATLAEGHSCGGPLLQRATLAEGHSCRGPLLQRATLAAQRWPSAGVGCGREDEVSPHENGVHPRREHSPSTSHHSPSTSHHSPSTS